MSHDQGGKNCLNEVGLIAEALIMHASSKQSSSYTGCTNIASYLAALQKDTSAHSCTSKRSTRIICGGLSRVSGYLKMME